MRDLPHDIICREGFDHGINGGLKVAGVIILRENVWFHMRTILGESFNVANIKSIKWRGVTF